MDMIVKVDTREQNPEIEHLLFQKYALAVAKELFPIGDCIINDEVVIERKSAYDFAQPVIDHRLFRQALRMKSKFDYCLFIIEGDIYAASIDIHQHAIAGAIVSIAVRWNIPVLFSKDTAQTALLIKLIAGQKLRICQNLFHRYGRRPKRITKRQLFLLQGLPRVGPALAGKLLNHFGSVEATMIASEEVLKKVDGIGNNKAVKIREVLTKKSGI